MEYLFKNILLITWDSLVSHPFLLLGGVMGVALGLYAWIRV
jgi:hypothetical protein